MLMFTSENIPAQSIMNNMHLVLSNERESLNYLTFHGIDIKLILNIPGGRDKVDGKTFHGVDTKLRVKHSMG